MTSFLSESAESVFKANKLNDLKDVCVVLPSRRATFFFKKELANLSETPFISPKVFAIDDFVCNLSGLQISDQVSLIFDLFECYKLFDTSVKFEEFITWAPTVLKDFDIIDQYLVQDVEGLFNYMSEAEALNRWQPDSEKAIETTAQTHAYFELYDNLKKVYFEFRKRLNKKAYRGMAYRLVAEDLEQIVDADLGYRHFYFIGLNALSKSEEKIISTLVDNKMATCYWDTDEWFMNSKHQAGDVLRNYRKNKPFGDWNEPKKLLQTTEKEINIYESPFNSLQAKVGTEFLTDQNTVFVVPDENLIQPLLFSMGNEVEEYNITMGLGMGQSKLSALINTIFELQGIGSFQSNTGTRFSHAFIQRILTDPLVKRYEVKVFDSENPFSAKKQDIINKNQVYVSEREMSTFVPNEGLLKALFTSWDNDAQKAIIGLKNITELLREQIFEDLDSMEKEFFMLFYSVLNRLQDELGKHADLSILSIKLLLKELSKLERVPFTGEPIAPLQIMSLLETRCLDFDHVVLFSFNEGIIPASSKNNSLIPYEACIAHGIPVFSDQDSIMAYHFYRLLMRAKKVDIIFTNAKSTGIGGSKDPSRFVLQLMENLAKENALIKIEKKIVEFKKAENEQGLTSISIKKNSDTREKIKGYLAKKGLSVSSISQYYSCSLMFYYSKILGLEESEEIEETFAANAFGNWIHESIEIISEEVVLLNTLIPAELKPKVKAAIPWVLDKVFKKHFEGYQVETGINLIYRKMAENLLLQYYEKCIFDGKERLILSVEDKFVHNLNLKIGDELISYFINGKIDSIEFEENSLMLIDFKTGGLKAGEFNLKKDSSLLQTFQAPDKSKFRQLVVYKYLIYKELERVSSINGFTIPSNTEIVPGMYSFRDLSKFHEFKGFEKEEIVGATEEAFKELVEELLNTEMPFEQTSDLKVCEYCSFKTICHR
ncbi:PD-(D/E)XK nuclease family protein [Arcticibacterium luteifluviistationis]|uniref:PD-(D/E)XK endonuclease-like domain-containing protein n=1 Tax=Arcticibacterium luteifluviistationis TaxID=1784714 RepID=A0A2Z4G6T0_9BACT|nr:PD-(D/E)XK nuclease family protein [Arcticibacterium luteifluviistationis]AWV96851.1 hypothetical protein DJ013_01085 [Arcticibacterium luteifluviistationis]